MAGTCLFVPLGLAGRLDPGRQADVCMVVMAVSLIISIILFRYVFFYLSLSLPMYMIRSAGLAAVYVSVCLFASSREAGPGKAGGRGYSCHGCASCH